MIELSSDFFVLAGRLALAVLLGGLIGLEREVGGQPAGFRTHITVALGATLFGIVSVDGFARFVEERAATNIQVDVTRVASQVVVGVGFLGAGVIVKHEGRVRGLTTAASVWVASAIGLAVGVAAYAAAVLTTFFVLASLVAFRYPRRLVRDYMARRQRTVVLRLGRDADVGRLLAALHDDPHIEVRALSVRTAGGDRIVEADLRTRPGTDLEEVITELSERADVDDVDAS